MDREPRKALIEKYLEAETTPSEEQRLREWFASHPAEGDEREIALLIGLSAPCGHCLPETGEAEAEFDRIVAASAAVECFTSLLRAPCSFRKVDSW